MGISEQDSPIPIGDLSIAYAALRLLWDLEDRGIDLRVAVDGRLHVTPSATLTPTDRGLIRGHRDALKALISICEEIR